MLAGSSGPAPRWTGLCAGVLLLGFQPASFAQPADDQPQANAEAGPPLAPAAPPEPGPASAPAAPAPAALAPAASVPAPTSIAAQPVAPAAARVRPYSLGITLSGSLESETSSTSFVTSPLIEAAYAVHPHILVDLKLGFAWLVDNEGLGESTFRAGNPQLAGHYHGTAGAWGFDVGLGVTAPLADVPLGPDGRLYESMYNRTLAMWGMWDEWLWLTDRLSVPVMAKVSYRFAAGPQLTVEQDWAVVIGVRGNASGAETLAQLALEAEFPVGSSFALGPRVQTVFLPSASIDAAQSAAVMRGSLKTSVGRFFASVLFNLDEPLAALRGGPRWGFHLGKEIDL